ncbi:MAG: alpha/beta hydrolase, partial [Desulfobacterales bacterium]|nr:alpha/beta hydrolase [Desulfobacterales bacterium]
NLSGTGSLTSKNVVTNGTVSLDTLALLDGSNGGIATNYTLAGGTHTASITAATLTLTTDAVTKTYDGSLDALGTATVSSGSLFDTDSLSGGTFGFTNANAGIGNKEVTVSNVTVNDGNGGSNYTVGYTSNTSSTINQAALTLSSSDVVKTYDGTTTAAGSAVVTVGTLYSNASNGGIQDSISDGTFAFTSPNVLVGSETVTVSGVTVTDGNGGGNYAVSYADNT